jgi:hypothetical protein
MLSLYETNAQMRQKTSPKKMTVHQKSNEWLFVGGLAC